MYTMCTLQYKDLYRLPHHPHHYWTTSTSSKFKYIRKEFINWKYPTARPLAQLHFPEKFQSRKLHFAISKATTARDIECSAQEIDALSKYSLKQIAEVKILNCCEITPSHLFK